MSNIRYFVERNKYLPFKTVLVAGGSRGIGRAVVEELTSYGKCVCFLYEKNEEAAHEVENAEGAHAIRCDIADEAAVQAAYAEAKRWMGSVEALVVCSGIAMKGLYTDITAEMWHRLSGVDLDGSLYLARAVLPEMISRKKGAIVFVSSVWGSVGASCEVHYSAAKAAIHGLTRALAKEVGPSGIRVNCVAPGVIDTDMNRDLTEEDVAVLNDETPLGRMGRPSEVAKAITFLLSENAAFITGQILGVDGGFGL